MTKAKGTACKNCKHVEVSHYKKTKDNKLPDAMVGTCKMALCPCTGFAPKYNNLTDLSAPLPGKDDPNLAARAYQFALVAHKNQKRDGGQPYIIHPVQTALILKQVTNDQEVIAAAYLHDTLEDTDTTYADLLQQFGKRVADLVHEVTHEREKRPYGQAYFPRLKTRDGILLKLADRLSNIADMGAWPEQRQQAYLRKTQFWATEPRPWEPK